MYTIKEACATLNVARATLYQRMDKLNIKAQRRGKQAYLSDEQIDMIRNYLDHVSDKSEPVPDTDTDTTFYIEQIKHLRQQANEKDDQIRHLQRALDQSQQLQAQSQAQLQQEQGKVKLLEASPRGGGIPEELLALVEKTRRSVEDNMRILEENQLNKVTLPGRIYVI